MNGFVKFIYLYMTLLQAFIIQRTVLDQQSFLCNPILVTSNLLLQCIQQEKERRKNNPLSIEELKELHMSHKNRFMTNQKSSALMASPVPIGDAPSSPVQVLVAEDTTSMLSMSINDTNSSPLNTDDTLSNNSSSMPNMPSHLHEVEQEPKQVSPPPHIKVSTAPVTPTAPTVQQQAQNKPILSLFSKPTKQGMAGTINPSNIPIKLMLGTGTFEQALTLDTFTEIEGVISPTIMEQARHGQLSFTNFDKCTVLQLPPQAQQKAVVTVKSFNVRLKNLIVAFDDPFMVNPSLTSGIRVEQGSLFLENCFVICKKAPQEESVNKKEDEMPTTPPSNAIKFSCVQIVQDAQCFVENCVLVGTDSVGGAYTYDQSTCLVTRGIIGTGAHHIKKHQESAVRMYHTKIAMCQ